MVKAIRNIELAMGNGVKKPSKSEKKNIATARKSIHLAKDLPEGHVLTADDLIMKRPGDGISPMHIEDVVGCKIIMAVPKDFKLNFSVLQ